MTYQPKPSTGYCARCGDDIEGDPTLTGWVNLTITPNPHDTALAGWDVDLCAACIAAVVNTYHQEA